MRLAAAVAFGVPFAAAAALGLAPAPAAGAPDGEAPVTATGMSAAFSPERLGGRAELSLDFQFSGGEEGVPAPLSSMSVRLPAGLVIKLGPGTCTRSRLQRRGVAGCSASSLVGRGHALLEVHAGSQTLPEESTIHVFRAPDRGGVPYFEDFGHGETPLDESVISTSELTSAATPYSYTLTTSIPPIPTVIYEPNASFVTLSLTLGTRSPGARAGSITLPRRCPSGGFPFAASFSFANGTGASAVAAVACPYRVR